MNEVSLMLNSNKKKLVFAKFRRRVRCNHRVTNRICCLKSYRERGIGNVSMDQCKSCSDAVKIEEKGVWCSFGQAEKK